jgi:hypothetical protein
LLDLLCYFFGDYKSYKLIKNNKDFSKGKVLFNNTKADFYLAIPFVSIVVAAIIYARSANKYL